MSENKLSIEEFMRMALAVVETTELLMRLEFYDSRKVDMTVGEILADTCEIHKKPPV